MMEGAEMRDDGRHMQRRLPGNGPGTNSSPSRHGRDKGGYTGGMANQWHEDNGTQSGLEHKWTMTTKRKEKGNSPAGANGPERNFRY